MIILFGLAGSGKGTQGKALSEIFGWRWISTGDLIRENGHFDQIINGGNMITDEDMIRLLEAALERTDAEGFNVILEGFPRTSPQAEWLLSHRDDIDGAVIIDVPKEELYTRLQLRGRADDDDKAKIDHRFAVFEQNICSILPLFEENNIPVSHVNGVGAPGTVTGRLIAAIQQFNPTATKQRDDVNGGEIEKSYGE